MCWIHMQWQSIPFRRQFLSIFLLIYVYHNTFGKFFWNALCDTISSRGYLDVWECGFSLYAVPFYSMPPGSIVLQIKTINCLVHFHCKRHLHLNGWWCNTVQPRGQQATWSSLGCGRNRFLLVYFALFLDSCDHFWSDLDMSEVTSKFWNPQNNTITLKPKNLKRL